MQYYLVFRSIVKRLATHSLKLCNEIKTRSSSVVDVVIAPCSSQRTIFCIRQAIPRPGRRTLHRYFHTLNVSHIRIIFLTRFLHYFNPLLNIIKVHCSSFRVATNVHLIMKIFGVKPNRRGARLMNKKHRVVN